MSAAAVSANLAIRKVQQRRQRAYEESILTPAQKRERQKKIQAKKKKLAEIRKRERVASYKTLALSPAHEQRIAYFSELRDSFSFQIFIIAVILIAGVLVGIGTYPIRSRASKVLLLVLEFIVIVIFVLEIVIKLIAEGKKPWNYFRDAWNVFDFSIVAIGFFPLSGGDTIMVLRLMRLLRVLKLVKALPKLRILVVGLIMSLSSIGYIGLLLFLVFYVFAIVGVLLYGANDPVNMGTLHIAYVSLFRAATLEDWTDLMYTSMYGCANYGYDDMKHLCTHSSEGGALAAVYWVLFIFIASMMILNLFIGVITASMDEAKEKLMEEADAENKMLLNEAAGEKLDESDGEYSNGRRASTRVDEELEGKYRALASLIREIRSDLANLKEDELVREKLRRASQKIQKLKSWGK